MSTHRAARVVLVTHYFPSHGGGVEVVAGKLACALASSGAATVEWFASDGDAAVAASPGMTPHPVPAWNGVERRSGLPFPVWSWRGMRELVHAVRHADLVHLHDYLYVGNLVAMIAARRWR